MKPLRLGVLISVASFLGLISSVSCITGGPPDIVVSKHFETEGAGFLFDPASRRARYIVKYKVLHPFEIPVLIRVEFENPLDQSSPLIVEQTLEPTQVSLQLESPPLPTIQNGSTYEIVLVAIDPNTRAEVARHTQPVRFYLSGVFVDSPSTQGEFIE